MFPIGMIVETLVAGLLVVTIGYCVLLNRRLQRLRADESALKATILELVVATETAERAIAGLRLATQECDQTLGQTLRRGEQLTAQLTEKIAGGDGIVRRLVKVAEAARAPVLEVDTAEVLAEERPANNIASMASAAAEAAQRLTEYRRRAIQSEAA